MAIKGDRRGDLPEITDEYLNDLTRLGRLQCTPYEVACVRGRTLYAIEQSLKGGDPRHAFEKGRILGIVELREAQFKLAATSTPMAMMLGKQYLNQDGRQEGDDNASTDRAGAVRELQDRIAALVVAAVEGRDPTGGE